MDAVDQANKTAFFGREFLTWIWFRSELQEGIFRPSWGESFELWFDDVLQLEVAVEKIREVVCVRSESPAEAGAAKAALQAGQKPTIAKLRLIRGEREWIFTLHADLTLHGVKLPGAPSKQKDGLDEEAALLRLFAVAELEATLDNLFADFLALRCDPDLWPAELEGMRAWVQGIDGFTVVDLGRIERPEVRETAPTWEGAGAGARRAIDDASARISRGKAVTQEDIFQTRLNLWEAERLLRAFDKGSKDERETRALIGKFKRRLRDDSEALALSEIRRHREAVAEFEHLDSEHRNLAVVYLGEYIANGDRAVDLSRILAVVRILRPLSDLAHSVRSGAVTAEQAERMRTAHIAEVAEKLAWVRKERAESES